MNPVDVGYPGVVTRQFEVMFKLLRSLSVVGGAVQIEHPLEPCKHITATSPGHCLSFGHLRDLHQADDRGHCETP